LHRKIVTGKNNILINLKSVRIKTMDSSNRPLETLSEIRDLMQRSSKFLSLSGLSGISAGIVALIGALVAYLRLKTDAFSYESTSHLSELTRGEMMRFVLIDGTIVLVVALTLGMFFTIRKAQKVGQPIWNSTSKRLIVSLIIPLITGGVFCLAMFYRGILWVSFPATLIFYGLALLNASKYTVRDLEYLGISEVVLGLISLFLTGYNLLVWAIGFGVLNIIYGAVMYFKYDRKS
jgi:predicted lysophospholipase L1 biosynthesis ABC-type transport system permease subunit